MVRLALALLPRLSHRALSRLARAMAAFGARWGGERNRRVALANLALALPDRTAAEHRAILKRSIQTFVLSMLEVFWLARDTHRRIDQLLRLGPGHDALLKIGPAVCVTAHMGNWELFGMAVSRRTGQPLTSVAAAIKNHRVDALFNELRRVTGQHMVPRKGALRQLIKALRGGGLIALLLDQNTKPVEGGVFVDFLGRPAPISSAAAVLAIRLNVPIVISFALPDGRGGYTATEPVLVDRSGIPEAEEEAVRVLTQRIADELSAQIRKTPEFWVWSYKRWKIRPPGGRAEDYPYYSRALHARDLPVAER